MRRLALSVGLGGVLLVAALIGFLLRPAAPPAEVAQAAPGPDETAILNDNRRRDLFERVWVFTRDSYADPEMRSLNWEEVHSTYAPRAIAAASDQVLYEVLDEMIGLLKDGASDFLTPEEAQRQDVRTETETPVLKRLANGIVYLRFEILSEDAATTLQRDASLTEGLIFDLRSRAGSLEGAAQLAGLFGLPDLGQRRSRTGTESLARLAHPAASLAPLLATAPLVVLIDEDTGAYAQLLAAALKFHGRAQVVGAQRGAAFSARAYNLFAGGSRLILADAELLLPDGSPAQITPDATVSADWLGVPEADDPYLTTAAELLRERASQSAEGAGALGAMSVSLAPAPSPARGASLLSGEVTGEFKAWYPVTLRWQGPSAHETDSDPNPFLDYRLQVAFVGPSGQSYNVPGFFNGDGEGGDEGNIWQVVFSPGEAGRWRYEASFRKGDEVAVDVAPEAGSSTAFDGASGSFTVSGIDPEAPGFKAKGRLAYVGGHYLQHQGDGSYYLKVGIDEPENWLAYVGFDNTSAPGSHDLHDYANHVQHWQPGDPTWSGEAGTELGKGIIGWLNYMADTGLNSMYFLPMNIGGDGKDTWPYVGPITSGRGGHPENDNTHFDLSKLRQWDTVFQHAQDLGILLHFVLNEGETANKEELGFELTTERKLFYRDLVARFGYHNAVRWNISEEYNSENAGDVPLEPDQILEFAQYLADIDPYQHAVTVHNWAFETDQNSTSVPITWETSFETFLGDERFHATSIQVYISEKNLGEQAQRYRALTAKKGRPLPVEFDEFRRVTPDPEEQAEMRKMFLWPILLSGGQLEYIIQGTPRGINVNDLTPYDALWDWSGYAQRFLTSLPFWEMEPLDDLVQGAATYGEINAQVFAKPGEVYAVYLPDASQGGVLELQDEGTFRKRWFNPRTGSFEGNTEELTGESVSFGPPPSDADEDWVVLIEGEE